MYVTNQASKAAWHVRWLNGDVTEGDLKQWSAHGMLGWWPGDHEGNTNRHTWHLTTELLPEALLNGDAVDVSTLQSQ